MTPKQGYAEALRRIAEAKATAATILDLSELELTSIPAELADCIHLQSLDLKVNQISRIENLPDGLQALLLSGSQISRIENLPDSLQSLLLPGNQISRIENLPDSLKSLHLASNPITSIENLPHSLQELVLSFNQISRIENLSDSLQSLDLRGNRISRIENLPDSLKSLILDENQISRIENLPDSLQSLELSGNRISRIENLPDSLQSLDLWKNQISRIENLPDGLQSVDLDGNRISSLDGLSIKILEQLEEIDLRNNPIQDIPSDELTDKIAILGYLKSKENSPLVENKFLKLNIIGEGRVGKTQFFNFLSRTSYQPKANETHGTNTVLYSVPSTNIQATVWDFGGQSYHHGFHKIFLGRTDFNIVLWRNLASQKPDYGYWLGTARAFSSDQQDGQYLYPLLLIQNVWHGSDSASPNARPDDICYPDSLPIARYQLGLNDVFAIDVKALFNEASSWQSRHRYFLTELHQRMIVHARRYKIAQIWLDIKATVDENPVTDINLKKDTFRATYASAITDDDIFEGLLAYLAFTGTILQFRNNPILQDYVFPNPPALSNWLYGTILDKQFKRKNQGKISRSGLLKKLEKNDEKVEIFIALMLSFELIFEQPHRSATDDPSETYYVIPQFLPEYQHSFKNVLLELLPFTFSLRFPDFMHEGRLFQFISTYGKYAIDNTAYWKYGLLYSHEVNRVATKTEAQHRSDTVRTVIFYLPEKRQLMVHVEDKKGRTEVAREIFDYFVFDIDPPASAPETRLRDVRKKSADALQSPDKEMLREDRGRRRDFLSLKIPVYLSTQAPHFFDVAQTATNIEARNFFGVCEDTQQRVNLNFMAINLPSNDSSRKLRVFFSYSHKDELYRNELENHCAMLKRSGRIETWHDRKIVAGEVWDDKIKDQLQQADIVLLMISADFLNSDYIWEHELGIIRKRLEKQDGLRVIPIFTRPCDTTEFDMMHFQGGQRDDQSKLLWISSRPDRDQIYTDIVGEIRAAINSMP